MYLHCVKILVFLVLCIRVQYAWGLVQYSVALLPQGDGASYQISLSNPSSAAADVSLYGDGPALIVTKTVAGDQSVQIDQAQFIQYVPTDGTGISNKTIIVESENDEIVVQVFITKGAHTEGYLGLPHSRLGTDYIVSTFCEFNGTCQFAVSTLQPGNTTVTVQFLPGVSDIVFCSAPGTFFRSLRPKALVLKQFQQVVFESLHDLSGTRVKSNQLVAVFSGGRDISVQGESGFVVEQLPPTSYFGTEFIVQTLGQNGYGDLLQIATTWPRTTVTMTGYTPFIIANISHVVRRRLDGGLTSLISASNPILVTQVSGLTYASMTSDTVAPGMTVVPSVQQAFSSTLLACGPETTGSYYLTGKGGATAVPFTAYGVLTESWSDGIGPAGSPLTDVTGILKCGDAALMPIQIRYNPPAATTEPGMTFGDQIDNDNDGGTDEDFCSRDTTVMITLTDNKLTHTHVENVAGAQIVKIRLQTCGVAYIKLTEQGASEAVFFELSQMRIRILICNPVCRFGQDLDIAAYYDGASCTEAVGLFWLRFDPATAVCMGTGHVPATSCTGVTPRYETGTAFDVMLLSAIMTTAMFNYDVLRGDCAVLTEDWRCEDVRTDCSFFSRELCSDPTYQPWMRAYCKVTCGFCTPDAYGKEFLAALPTGATMSALFAVTKGDGASVDSGTKLAQPVNRDNQNTALFLVPQPSVVAPVFIRSQSEDSTVSILYAYDGSDHLHTLNVLPFDALSTEYMAVTYCATVTCTCSLVAREVETLVNVLPAQPDTSYSTPSPIQVEYGGIKHVAVNAGDSLVGTVFTANKPLYVFCGAMGGTSYSHYNQMIPTKAWGKRYRTPTFEADPTNRPYEGKLRIVSNFDNNRVTINGDFDSTLPLYSRGSYRDFDIDVGSNYTVESEKPIAVGLLLYDATRAAGEAISFSLLPPDEQLSATHAMPVYGVRAIQALRTTLSFEPSRVTSYFTDLDPTESPITEADFIHYQDPDFPMDMAQACSSMTVVKTDSSLWYTVQGQQLLKPVHGAETYCTISETRAADGRDNDCDDLHDEEDVCFSGYGASHQDVDLDGWFGEDCREFQQGADTRTPDPDPACVQVRNVSGQCWELCECPCTWLQQLARKEAISTEQYLAEQENRSRELQGELTVDAASLSSTSQKKVSARDRRPSAASIGYVGIALFVVIFGSLIILDLGSLIRDARIIRDNVKEGFMRVRTALAR